ncbi:S8 family serine peptidase [Oceanospirillum sediminis]|uniref:S8 family serine peptidase n=1 Tax=Oceanospirillum sediminis TaxID=2760088 RepID=A0A839IMA7_9GAMM|nr:S8 family serine peptidase [Oceanospirillum sediminis]MBB1485850.1 S8 family serine peptidase [Oceanospirillum sediminis]
MKTGILSLESWNAGLLMPGLSELKHHTRGHSDIKVAVLDSGVEHHHPFLRHQQLHPSQHAAEHGTHICSVISGDSPDGYYQGIAPKIALIPIEVYQATDKGDLLPSSQQVLARAIHHACDSGAHLINISGGDTTRFNNVPGVLADACKRAFQENRLIIAAAGNNGSDTVHTPACLPGVLAVGAASWDSRPSQFSNFGQAYQNSAVLAPGEDIPGAGLNHTLCTKTGTSFAAPVVTAIAALFLSLQKTLNITVSPTEIRELILHSAAPAFKEEKLEPARVLAGRINPLAMMKIFFARYQINPQSDCFQPGSGNRPARITQLSEEQTMTEHQMPAASQDTPGYSAPATEGTIPREHSPRTVTSVANPQPSSPVTTQPHPRISAQTSTPQHNTAQVAPQPVATPYDHQNHQTVAIAQPGIPAYGLVTPDIHHSGYQIIQPQSSVTGQPQHYIGQQGVQNTTTVSASGGTHSVQTSALPMSASDPRAARQLIYCLGSIGFDFQIEARMDYFIQRLAEYQDGSLDQRLFRYIVEHDDWDNAELLTWVVKIDGTPTYAIKPHGAGKRDLYRLLVSCLYYQLPPDKRPVIEQEFYTSQQRMIAARYNLNLHDNGRLNTKYIRDKDEFDYRIYMEDEVSLHRLGEYQKLLVDLVAVAGEVIGEVQLYNGSVVPQIEVVISGLSPWNKAGLIEQQVSIATGNPVVSDYINRASKGDNSNQKEASLREEIHQSVSRALEKIYHEFKNNGLNDDDRAINYVGTNIMNLVDVFSDVFEVLCENDKVCSRYEFDNAYVETSKVQRPTSILKDVILRFFEPGNLDKAYKCYRFTVDVSDINPVMVEGKPKVFYESAAR